MQIMRHLAIAAPRTPIIIPIHRPLQAPKVSGIFPEKFRKYSGKFPTFYFSGKVTTIPLMHIIISYINTRIQFIPVIGEDNGARSEYNNGKERRQ